MIQIRFEPLRLLLELQLTRPPLLLSEENSLRERLGLMIRNTPGHLKDEHTPTAQESHSTSNGIEPILNKNLTHNRELS